MTQPKLAEKLEVATLAALRDEALSFLKIVDEAMKIMESDVLASYNLKSGLEGIDRLKSFQDALKDSILLHKTGRPLRAGQLKSRSRGNQSKNSLTFPNQSTSKPQKVAEKKRKYPKTGDAK